MDTHVGTAYTPSERDIAFARKLHATSPGWFNHVMGRPDHTDHQLIQWAKMNLPEITPNHPTKHADASLISGQKRKMEQ